MPVRSVSQFPRGSHILIDDWKIYRDQSTVVATGKGSITLLPLPSFFFFFTAHDSGLQNTHAVILCAHVPTTRTHSPACTRNKVSRERSSGGIERAVDKSKRARACEHVSTVHAEVCLIFMVVFQIPAEFKSGLALNCEKTETEMVG